MFRVFLQHRFERLPKAKRIDKRLRAAHYMQASGDYEAAIEQLLLIDRYMQAMKLLKTYPIQHAMRYLERIPVDMLASDFSLAFQRTFYHLVNLEIERAQMCIQAMRCIKTYSESEKELVNLIDASFLQYDYEALTKGNLNNIADLMGAIDVPMHIRLMIELNIAVRLFYQEHYEAAYDITTTALHESQTLNNSYLLLYARLLEAQIYEQTGRLDAAHTVFKTLLDTVKKYPDFSVMKPSILTGHAGVYIKQFQLDKAVSLLEEAWQINTNTYQMFDQGNRFNTMEVHALQANHKKAKPLLLELLNEIDIAASPFFALAMRYILMMDVDVPHYKHAFETMFLERQQLGIVRSDDCLIMIRLRLLDKQCDQALSLLNTCLRKARKTRSMIHLIEGALLKAHHGMLTKNLSVIKTALIEAFHHAKSNQIIAPFVMDKPLLQAYVSRLLLSPSSNVDPPLKAFIMEVMKTLSLQIFDNPLSAREHDVLIKIAEGASNRAIASALHISLSTVKTHINNIYEKLDVNTRVAAIKKAKTVGIELP